MRSQQSTLATPSGLGSSMTRHRSTVLLAACVTCLGWSLGAGNNPGLEPAIAQSAPAKPSAHSSLAVFEFQKSLSTTVNSIAGTTTGRRLQIAQAEKRKPAEVATPKPDADKPRNRTKKLFWLLLALVTTVAIAGGGIFLLLKWFGNTPKAVEPKSLPDENDFSTISSTANGVAPETEILDLEYPTNGHNFSDSTVSLPSGLPLEREQVETRSSVKQAKTQNSKLKTQTRQGVESSVRDSDTSALVERSSTGNNNHVSDQKNSYPTPNSLLPTSQQSANHSETQPKVEASDGNVPVKKTTRLSKIDIVSELIKELRGPNPQKRRKAIWELAQQGDSRAVQPLVDLMIDSDSQQRSLILEALSQIATKTLKPMNRALAVSLQDDNAEVRKNAIRDLTRIYELIAQTSQMLCHAADDPDPEVRETARWAISQLSRIRTTATLDNLPPSQSSQDLTQTYDWKPPG